MRTMSQQDRDPESGAVPDDLDDVFDDPAAIEDRPSRTATVTAAQWLALAVAAVAAVSLLWLAAETRYRGCVEHAAVRHQDRSDLERLARNDALDRCRRLPF